jgi:hypothetical protein
MSPHFRKKGRGGETELLNKHKYPCVCIACISVAIHQEIARPIPPSFDWLSTVATIVVCFDKHRDWRTDTHFSDYDIAGLGVNEGNKTTRACSANQGTHPKVFFSAKTKSHKKWITCMKSIILAFDWFQNVASNMRYKQVQLVNLTFHLFVLAIAISLFSHITTANFTNSPYPIVFPPCKR